MSCGVLNWFMSCLECAAKKTPTPVNADCGMSMVWAALEMAAPLAGHNFSMMGSKMGKAVPGVLDTYMEQFRRVLPETRTAIETENGRVQLPCKADAGPTTRDMWHQSRMHLSRAGSRGDSLIEGLVNYLR